jgi:hypothetical protein
MNNEVRMTHEEAIKAFLEETNRPGNTFGEIFNPLCTHCIDYLEDHNKSEEDNLDELNKGFSEALEKNREGGIKSIRFAYQKNMFSYTVTVFWEKDQISLAYFYLLPDHKICIAYQASWYDNNKQLSDEKGSKNDV